jgi:hypothetical protein
VWAFYRGACVVNLFFFQSRSFSLKASSLSFHVVDAGGFGVAVGGFGVTDAGFGVAVGGFGVTDAGFGVVAGGFGVLVVVIGGREVVGGGGVTGANVGCVTVGGGVPPPPLAGGLYWFFVPHCTSAVAQLASAQVFALRHTVHLSSEAA